ncbi:unnamed protein product [Camellia sinensis]
MKPSQVPSTPMKVFSNNMGKKSEPVITKCKESENWTKVTFKPDLAKFNMTHLEDDVVALMKKRVIDLAGCLGKTVKVELNGQCIPIKSFLDYVNLYLQSASKARLDALPEYMPGGSLSEYIHKNHIVLNLPQLLQFAIDVCSGMEYLHQNNIIHRDLKTTNLLMDNDKVVKVADFGIARFQNQGGVMTAETGTYRWMAPEVINHQPYDQKADIFSFAIVLWELVTAKVPYDTMTPLQAALE